MWIVALALRRPYTFVVMAIVIIVLFFVTLVRTPVDIFPDIDIPVVSVVWFYTGMSPQDMADRIVANSERGITTTVNDIEHMESQSVYGLGIIKVFFRPGTNVQGAIAQITAICQTTVRGLPPGTTPPLIISYSASTTPIIQLGLSSKTLPEQDLFDLGQNFLRNFLATVPGAATPYPYGGKIRQIQVDLDLPKLQAYGLEPNDIVNAVNAQNIILPTRHHQTGPDRIQRGDERHAADDRGIERPAGQDHQRVHALHARCCPHPRRLRATDQHRASGWQPRRADVDLQERQRVHAATSLPASRTSLCRRRRRCRRN